MPDFGNVTDRDRILALRSALVEAQAKSVELQATLFAAQRRIDELEQARNDGATAAIYGDEVMGD